ncbi:MAG TPA: SDR family NAD(P)-dependent oxidoreductase [Hyphomicrobiales bacterium]|nr:SDR family NAD(P)-dependent oxidoreductase [Hyphomicrobiales bacterium]
MSLNPLRGGVALVTGAASGIGASLAAALAKRSCNLALADLNQNGLIEVAARVAKFGVAVSTHVLDVADADAVAALPREVQSHHDRLTILVNNAGVALNGRFDQVSLADFKLLMDINFWGVVHMTKAFLPILQRERASNIVNISSLFGIVAAPGQAAYCSSKFAVRGFSESLRQELAPVTSPIVV